MLGVFKSGKFWIGVGCFAGGVFATSKLAKKIAVKGIATGMKAKDGIVAGWNNMKEEAEDIYEAAKEEAVKKADEDEQAALTQISSHKTTSLKKPAKKIK